MKPLFQQPEPVNYFWKDLVLTESEKNPIKIDLSESYSLEEGLVHFSSELSFIERLEMIETVQQFQPIDLNKYFSSLGQHFDLKLHLKILNRLKTWPKEFVEWAKLKCLNPKDFRFFLNEDQKELNDLLRKVSNLKPSKMNGLQTIDLSLDLLAHQKITIEKIKNFKNDQILLSYLKKIRFAEAIKNDEEINSRFLKLNLSQDVKINVSRFGDENKICLKINSSTPESLSKKIDHVQKKISEIQKAWVGETP